MRILLIEDDPETARFIRKGLEEAGHVVDHAGDGKQGLLLALDAEHDAVVVDRMLPGLDGLSIVRSLRAAGRDTPVLVLSALGEVDDRVEGLRAGGDDYLVKPFALAELSARLEALARRRNPGVPTRRRRSPGSIVADLEMDLLARSVKRAGRSHRAQAPRVPAARVPDAPRRPGGYPHDAAGGGVGLPLRSADQRHRRPREPPAPEDRSRIRCSPLIHTVRGAGYVIRAP